MVMTLGWKEWKVGDILYGVIIPLIVALVIIVFPTVLGPYLHAVDQSFTLESIFVAGLEEAILIVAVPLLIGLLWNKWAGGAAGFLLGSIYALATFQLYGLSGSTNIFLLGYTLSGMLIGYIAGALNKGSYTFLRLLIAGVVAAIVGGLFLYFTYAIPADILNGTAQQVNMAAPDYVLSFTLTMVPRIIYGIIIPIIAKVFYMFGVTASRMT